MLSVPVGEGHVAGGHSPVDQPGERVRVPRGGGSGLCLLVGLRHDRDVVVDALVVVVHRHRQGALRHVLAWTNQSTFSVYRLLLYSAIYRL